MAWDYESTKSGYENMWETAEILSDKHDDLQIVADRILKSEARYRAVEADTGVPWFWIGAIHSRESDCNFNTHLHNGDPLTARTTHVPAGRPTSGSPPFTWEESAMDALAYQDLIGITPWDCAQMHLQAELYNGTGYANKGVNSPYLWAMTNHQQPGKYVGDGDWDPNAWDKQAGTSGIWLKLCETRPDVAKQFITERPVTSIEKPRPTVNIQIEAPQGIKLIVRVNEFVMDYPPYPEK
jgi:lysozyme family protein